MNASLIPEAAERVNAICNSRGVNDITRERMLAYAGAALHKGGSVDDAVAIVRSTLDSSLGPEAPAEIPLED